MFKNLTFYIGIHIHLYQEYLNSVEHLQKIYYLLLFWGEIPHLLLIY